MDVEHRAGQLYNSELPSAYIGLSISNNSNMNQFVNQKPKFRKHPKSQMISNNNKNKDKSHSLTPTFDVLPKIESNKFSLLNDEILKENVGQPQASNNNSSIISDISKRELPLSEEFTKNNVGEWLQMPSKSDSISNDYNGPGSSVVSYVSGTMLTPVEVDYFTDCTSVTSSEWGDDVCEFDKNESHKVNQMFEEIEWMLFNDKYSSIRSNRTSNSTSFSDRNGLISGPVHLRRECSEWTNQFPHFRLVGRQISVPQEQGYTFNESERSGSVTPKNSPRVLISEDISQSSDIIQSRWISASSDVERLSLVGHSIKPKITETDPSIGFDELSLGSSQEEVFALDGDMIEIIAIDYKMDEDYKIHSQKKCSSKNAICRNGKPYPPVTPNAVIRDAVLTAVFDNLWSHIVDCVLPLSTKIYQTCTFRDIITMDQAQPISLHSPMTPDFYRISKPFTQLPTSLNNLDNILKISSKTLQFREKSYLQSIPEQSQNLAACMKNSLNFNAPKQSLSFINQIRKPNKCGLSQDRSQTPLSVNESSFIQDREMKRTPPLNQSYFMSSFYSENHSPLRCLRGKALYHSNSPDLLARSGTLPPIHKYPTLTHFRPTGSRIGSAQVHNSINQSSSFINNSLATHVLMTTDIANMRPCTSHTARSDQIGGNRSSTPSGTRGSLNLNVHGNSITINNLSMKANDEVPFEQSNKITRNKPYWKTYNNQIQTSNKRNKSVYNSVK